MKLFITAMAAVLVLVWLTPEEAEAQSRSRTYRTAEGKKQYRYYGRRASVSHTGLCQRDTGTSTSNLNFRNRCDTEEYWNRVLGGRGRR